MSEQILYLRTVYDLNLRAGGSVGHTAGMVNALAKATGLDLVSNEALPGTWVEARIIPPVHPPLPKGEQELLYNLKVIAHMRGRLPRYHAIYQRYSGSSFAGAYLARKHRIPLVLEFNSSPLWTLKNWRRPTHPLVSAVFRLYLRLWKIPLVVLLEKYNLRSATLIVVVSEPLRNTLRQAGIPDAKILVLPNAIDPECYTPELKGHAIRRQLGFADKLVFGYIGSFGYWHGVLELAQAIIRFFQHHPLLRDKVRFLLIGDGVLARQTKGLIEASPYSDQVVFTGEVEQAKGPAYLAACDALLSPHIPNPDGSPFFGSPTKLFEYMGMGKAIIASDLEQIGDVLQHGQTAWLVPPGDIAALTDAMVKLYLDPGLRQRLGAAARQAAVRHHTWDRNAAAILQALDRQS